MTPDPNVRPKNPRRPILVGGVCLLGLGTALLVAAVLLASSPHAGLREAAGMLRAASPWVFLSGALVMLLWLVVSRAARAPVTRKSESTLFRESTQLGDPADDRSER